MFCAKFLVLADDLALQYPEEVCLLLVKDFKKKKKAKLKLKIKFLKFAPVKTVHIFYSVHRRSMHSATTVWYMNVF